jgi:hypothetical protein
VIAGLGVRQRLDNADDGNSEINQSFFKYLRCHGAVLNQSKIKIQQSSIVNQTAVVEELGDRQIWQLWT